MPNSTTPSLAAAAVLLVVGLLGTGPVACETLELWAGLEPGPHAVGFRAIFAVDETRPYSDRPGSPSAPFSGVGRPLRIFVWYPAAGEPCETLRFGDLVSTPPPDERFERWNRMLDDRTRHLLTHSYGTGERLFERLAGLPLLACRDATPTAGHRPWVVYSTGSNSHQLENLVLFEYLASHGFVVASLPQLARQWPATTLGRVTDSVSTETQIGDLELAIALLARELPVDRERLGLVGFSGGGLYALELAGRYTGLARAVVTLDGSASYSHAPDVATSELSFRDPHRRLALLDVHKASERLATERFDALPGLEVCRARFDDAYHLDFTGLPLAHRLDPEAQGYYTAAELDYGVALQRALAPMVRAFLERHLMDDPQAAERLAASCDPPARCAAIECRPGRAALSADQLVLAVLEAGASGFLGARDAELERIAAEVSRDAVLRRAAGFSTFYLLDEATEVLAAATALWPRESDVHVATARLRHKQGQLCEAAAAFDRAIELARAGGDVDGAQDWAAERDRLDASDCRNSDS